tara:strand:- start:1019 stop:1420 length:402 start_codon:yes stop_codon:yes gene_type:complete
MALTEQEKKEYMDYFGGQCPKSECKSKDIHGGHIEMDGSTAWAVVRCDTCGYKWKDVFTLSGVEDIEIRKPIRLIYIIRGTTKNETDPLEGYPLYWSNEDGWVDYDSADQFSQEERDKLNLPMNGEWMLARGE